jgi:restriction system protein
MRHHSFGTSMRMIARQAARAQRARQRAQATERAAAVRALRNAERQAKADAKEAARLHAAAQIEEAEDLSRAVQDREKAIDNLLTRALAKNPMVDLTSVLKSFTPKSFDEPQRRLSAPNRDEFTPKAPSFFARLLPGATGRHEGRVLEAKRRFDAADAAYIQESQLRAETVKAFETNEKIRREEVDRHNTVVLGLQRGLQANEHSAIVGYFKLIIDHSLEGEPDAVSSEVGYGPDSRHLVVDLELPELSVIPEVTGFRYVKATDRIEPIIRPPVKRKTVYANLLCQVALKCIDTVVRGGPSSAVECLTLNGMLDTIDPATGRQVRVCLLSVRITTDAFHTLNLGQVQPEHCLRSLKASVSRAPAELLPVKPLIELDMVDPRFVTTLDVMSELDHRPNLMELTPTEFEGLITNLFAGMGLDTRQTRPSRDGGVDCVAFDSRPIFGGKVVIQAKRYKNTVGVSAVRDLFGTVVNEGASKGILVTTSGYGKAAFEFAKGKPLELLDGANLLHLLAEHASIEARIVIPEDWVDLPVHGE